MPILCNYCERLLIRRLMLFSRPSNGKMFDFQEAEFSVVVVVGEGKGWKGEMIDLRDSSEGAPINMCLDGWDEARAFMYSQIISFFFYFLRRFIVRNRQISTYILIRWCTNSARSKSGLIRTCLLFRPCVLRDFLFLVLPRTKMQRWAGALTCLVPSLSLYLFVRFKSH